MFKQYLAEYQQRTESTLDRWLPDTSEAPQRLHEAMRYVAMNGGKRVRPLLVYLTGKLLGVDQAQLDGPACAIELIHVYSLVHDDLPAMDDDELRRGKPTCHKAFDEATAILVGDALQSLAFEVLSRDPAIRIEAGRRLLMLQELAVASGSRGMAGGQAIDIDAAGSALSLPELEAMHALKTGALLRTSVRLGALSAPQCDEAERAGLDSYAQAIGLAFQVQDDILDVTADTATLGKPQGSDQAQNKPTYVSLLGLDGARAKARELHQQALDSLSRYGEQADPLRQVAAYIVERGN